MQCWVFTASLKYDTSKRWQWEWWWLIIELRNAVIAGFLLLLRSPPFYLPSFHLARSQINGWGDDDNDDDGGGDYDDSGGGTGALVVRPTCFFSSQDSRNCLELLDGVFLMSVTFSCLNVIFTIGWRVGCKFRNRWCCSYWGRPLDANSYWGEASWCSWSDVLPMLLLAWILWLAPLCLIIIICNHKYTYNTETITSTLILYTSRCMVI